MRAGFGAVGVRKARSHAVVVELDPLSRTGKSMATWDAEVGNASIIEGVPFRGSLEGFLIFEDAVLKAPNLFGEPMVLHRRVGFTVGNSGEEAVRNAAKEYRVDVVIGGEGRLDCPRRHCRWNRSCRTRDWKGCRRFGR